MTKLHEIDTEKIKQAIRDSMKQVQEIPKRTCHTCGAEIGEGCMCGYCYDWGRNSKREFII